MVERRARYLRALELAPEKRKRSLGQLTRGTEHLSPGKEKDQVLSDRHQEQVRQERDIEDFEREDWGKVFARNDTITHLTMEFMELWQYLRSFGF